jgi:hypothetical protein
MTQRKPAPSLLYSSVPSTGWVRTLSSFIDEGVAALCMRQWQSVPVRIAQPLVVPVARRRTR